MWEVLSSHYFPPHEFFMAKHFSTNLLMCNVYAPEEDVSENDGNPEPDADELQCQDGDVRLRPRLRVRGLSADVHGGGNSKSATAYSRFE